MDEQLKQLLDATIAQTKAEEEKIRLEKERIKIEDERTRTEKVKLETLNTILAEIRAANKNINDELVPASKVTVQIMPILLEIQRIVIMRVVSSANQDEEIKRLKDLLAAMNNDLSISISGDVDKLIGQKNR